VSPVPALWQRDRISRLTALGPEDTAAGLLWLAMNFPAVCDAMLDKLESDDIDDTDSNQEPEPFAPNAAPTSRYSCASAWTGATITATALRPAGSSYSTPDTTP
jgi:hypothetical protein